MKLIKLFIVVSLVLTHLSCRKDKENSDRTIELLTGQSWIQTGERWSSDNTTWTEVYQGMISCRKDNKITYYKDFSVITDEGSTKCNSTDPQVFDAATWQLYDNNSKLVINNGINVYLEIIQLDDQVLKTLRRDTVPPYINLYEYTFNH